MKKGWEIKKLRQVCELVNGRAYSKPELLDSGRYRVLRVGNFFTNDHWYYSDLELEEKKYCDTGDLLYAWSASFGPRIWTGGKVIYHYHIWKVVHDCSRIDQKFLFYFFQWDTEKIKEDQRTGTTMMHVSMGSMNEREIPVPPLDEQHRIVALLDEAFETLAIAKANAEQNLQNARALLESHLQSIFDQQEEAGPTYQLGDVCDFQGGSQPPKSQFSYTPKDGYVRFLQIRDFGSEKHITYIPESRKNRLCTENDTMIGRYGASVGKILTGKAGAYNVALMKATPDGKLLEPNYFHYYLLSGAFQNRLSTVAARSAQNGFSKEDIHSFPVPIPSLEQQRYLIDQIAALSQETQHLTSIYERKLAALGELKASLLHQAFNGEL